MRITSILALCIGCYAVTVAAQSPSSAFDRGNSLQAWQDPGLAKVLEQCRVKPAPFGIPSRKPGEARPPIPAMPESEAIPGVIAAGQTWKVVWAWQGNNADGLIAGENGTLLFANNDAGNVMRLDPATGMASILYDDANTAGALSRSKNGALFLATRGLGWGIEQLEPQRRMLANTFNNEPMECVGGVMNDLVADARGGAYFAVTGRGLFYASPDGDVSEYGEGITLANGIILSPDEETLYVTNGQAILAFDVAGDGSLSGQREFGRVQGFGDGAAVDEQGRLYVATGNAAAVFSADGKSLGSIPGPQGLHGVAFGGRDKKTLYGIVFYGTWGHSSARNLVIGIPTVTQGYTGRAK